MAGGQHRNENQNFGTIFQSGVSKIQHNHGPTRSLDRHDLVMAEITNAAWKLVIFDGVMAESAQAAVRDVAKAFEELVPTIVLKDRAFAIAIELRHPAYDCFYLAVAERSTSPL